MEFKNFKKTFIFLVFMLFTIILTSCSIYDKKIDVYLSDFNKNEDFDEKNYYVNINFLDTKFNNYFIKEVNLDNKKYDIEDENLELVKDFNKFKIIIKLPNNYNFLNKKYYIIEKIKIKFVKENNSIGYLNYSKPLYIFEKLLIDQFSNLEKNLVYIQTLTNDDNLTSSTGFIIKKRTNLNKTYRYYILATKHAFYNYKNISVIKKYKDFTIEKILKTEDIQIVKQGDFKLDLVLISVVFSQDFDILEYDYLFERDKKLPLIYQNEPVLISGYYKVLKDSENIYELQKKLAYIKKTNVSYMINQTNNIFLTNYYNGAFLTDNKLKKGTSGGPVFDKYFNFIGINSANNLLDETYHISLFMIKDFLKNIKELKK